MSTSSSETADHSPSLLERLHAGEVILGINNMYPAAGIIEGMCKGWDLVWIDCQHGQMDYDSTISAVRAADGMGLETMVRVPTHDPLLLGLYADMQPSAIMIPMVDTPDDAKKVVQGLRFPPVGNRSYGGRRPIDLYGRDYYLDRNPAVAAQVETLESAGNADAIIGMEGIDILFFGPDDMKLRMGLPVSTVPTENEEIMGAMKATVKAAKDAGKIAATVAPSSEAVERCLDMGFRFLIGGSDIVFLRTLAPQRLEELRSAVEGRKTAAAPKAADKGSFYGN